MMFQPNRRQVMLAAAAAAGATWFDVPRLLADTREASLKKYGGFAMGIQSYSLRGFGVDVAIEKMIELELHNVEFFQGHFKATNKQADVDAMKAKLAKGDISISAWGVQGFGKNHDQNKAYFEFAKLVGMRNISAAPSEDSFESLDKLVKEYDIRIAIHNHGPTDRYKTPDDVLKAVAKWDKRIGFCADLGHYIRAGVDPVEAVEKLGERLYGVHLKDFAEKKGNAKGVVLGKGVMDVAAVFKALKKVKFPADGALSLEYEENPKDPMAELKACFDVAAEAAQKA